MNIVFKRDIRVIHNMTGLYDIKQIRNDQVVKKQSSNNGYLNQLSQT